MNTRRPYPYRDQRGSVLIVALLLAAIVAICLTSFIQLSTQATTMSYRSLYAGVAMNSAESGLEQAMWSINKKKTGSTTAWDGWDTSSGTTARRTFSLGSVAGGGSVSVKVLVSDRNLSTTAPYAIARAIVTPIKGDVIEKWIKITLHQRSYFSNGLVAKKGITFSGNNPSVDSYNSANGSYTPSPSTVNRFPRGSAGSTSVVTDSLSVGNADVYGSVSIGTSDYSGLDVGSQGKVTGDFNAANGTIDYSHVATNFTYSFDVVSAPSETATTLGTVGSSITLPLSTSDANSTDKDGKVTYYYTANSISLTNDKITISPGYNVVITVSGSVDVGGGSGSIEVKSTSTNGVLLSSSLNIYAAGNVTIAGNGAVNTLTTTTGTTTSTTVNRPQDFMIWGTATTSQTIKVAGNGELSAVVYAPNAAIEAKGGGNSGSLYGAFIGNTVKMTGNDAFHYDESLKDLDSGEPLGIDKWDEFVSSADRTTYASVMNF
ncbi:MAG TPA: hypothetical protein VIM44_01855 [Rariglobus sp.]